MKEHPRLTEDEEPIMPSTDGTNGEGILEALQIWAVARSIGKARR